MPLYEYKCEECRKEFEKLVPASKRNEPGPCPKCGSYRLSKRISLCGRTSAKVGDASCATST